MMIFVSTLETQEVTGMKTRWLLSPKTLMAYQPVSDSLEHPMARFKQNDLLAVGRTLWTMSLLWMTLPLIRISLRGSFQ